MVRIGVMWEAVEKERGVYDLEYLDTIELIVNKLASYNIVTMLDAHQDLFARDFCGEGIPSFYVKDLSIEHICPDTPGGWMFWLGG